MTMELAKPILTHDELLSRIDALTPEQIEAAIESYERLSAIREFAGILDYRPNSFQDKFHNSDAKERLFLGANMAGKTVAGAKETVCYLLGEDPSGTTTKKYPTPPNHGWAGSPRTDMAMNVSKPEILHWLPKDAYAGFDKRELKIICKNGSTVGFRSYEMDISAWQGAALDFAWMDEQTPYGHYMELRSRVNRRMGSIWMTMTPLYANSSWSYKELFLTSQTNRNIWCMSVPLEDNKHLTQEMIDRQTEQFKGTPDEAARLRGEYVNLQGRIFFNYNPTEHFIPAAPVLEMLRADRDHDGARQFRYDRVIDAHPRSPDVCVWFAYNPEQPVVYIIREIGVPNMHASEFGRLVASESREFGKITRTLLDTPESTSETELGTSIRSCLASVGVPSMRPVKNFMYSRDMVTDYIEQKAFYVLDTCPKCNLALQTMIWDDWKGTRRFEDAPKERPKGSPETHYSDCIRYEMSLQRPLSFTAHEKRPKLLNDTRRGESQRKASVGAT